MEARILEGEKLRITQDPKEIHEAVAAKKPIWIELQQKDHACDVLLAQQLELHPLTIEDIWANRSQPKLEDFENYLYIIIHGIEAKPTGIKLIELDLVIGPTYVITYDQQHLVDAVRDQLDHQPR